MYMVNKLEKEMRITCTTPNLEINCAKVITPYNVKENVKVKVNYLDNYFLEYNEETEFYKIYIEEHMGSTVRKECYLTFEQLITQFIW